MLTSHTLSIRQGPIPEFANVEEFLPWAGRFVWMYRKEVYNLCKPMRLYRSKYGSIPELLFEGVEFAFFEEYRPRDSWSQHDCVRGFFNEFERRGGGTFDDFVDFFEKEAMYSAMSRMESIYNAGFFAEIGYPRGKPRTNAKRRYKTVIRWLIRTSIRNTFKPMYEAWLNGQTLGEPEPEPGMYR